MILYKSSAFLHDSVFNSSHSAHISLFWYLPATFCYDNAKGDD